MDGHRAVRLGASAFAALGRTGPRRTGAVPPPAEIATVTPVGQDGPGHVQVIARRSGGSAARKGGKVANADDVRRLALALANVREVDSDGFDFRVADKGFIWSYPERTPGQPRRIRTDIAVLFVGDEAEKQALLLGEPQTFFTAPGYDGWPLVMLRLARVDIVRLEELVTDAWRMRAPVGPLDRGDEAGAR
jgi:hypothetical protein